MKELTYEDWQKNPTPRMMWVWDNKEADKIKRKVIYFVENKDVSHLVIALSSDSTVTANYKHCAEIEKSNTRRMTNKELAHWLKEKPTREFKYSSSRSIYGFHSYDENCGDEEVRKDVVIREDDSEWKEPLVEVEL